MSEAVRAMFANIAPRYDVVNVALSFGIDRLWRRRLIRLSGAREGASALDCATGTGDVALALKQVVGPRGSVLGTDFCAEMLESAPRKAAKRGLDVRFEVADAMRLPYPDETFDLATISFGIRNVDHPPTALKEMARVVRRGGRVAVLEFGQPTGVFGALYRLYSERILPVVGGAMSGNREAYSYLNRTAAAFPCGEAFAAIMRETGAFESVSFASLTFGVAYIYVGERR
jgi:demethylmenaquinone methyltransferase/2-methoxy-6-polyprenyl-1,4-benzoquinol methylase